MRGDLDQKNISQVGKGGLPPPLSDEMVEEKKERA
jgi:hypothetical protein